MAYPKSQVVYEEFDGKDLIALLKSHNPGRKHPRLLVSEDFFERIREEKETDPFLHQIWKGLEADVEKALGEPASVYDIYDGIRLNAGRTFDRVKLFSLFFRVTGEQKYLDAAWEELASAAAFPDFNPYHFLDTATMSAGLGLGYDWLYEFLSDEQRGIIRDAIIEKGLKVVMIDFLDQPRRRSFDWCHGQIIDNWTFVCCGGVSMAALAIGDETDAEEVSGSVLSEALHNMERAFWMFAPDGAWVEGIAYWNYATLYYTLHMACLESALGCDCGRFREPGLHKSADFVEAMNGSAGNFNFSDNGAVECIRPAQLLWFARKCNRPELAKGHIQDCMSGRTHDFRDLIWYDREFFGEMQRELPLDAYFPTIETVTMRSGWNPEAVYVGFHGGKNNETHAHLDVGSFVLDALGERFILDLGKDDYNLKGGVFNRYRYRAEGHNTLVIRPDSGYDQELDGYGEMIHYISNDTGEEIIRGGCRKQNSDPSGAASGADACAVCDMSAAYAGKAEAVKRSVALVEGRSSVIIRDEIRLAAPTELYWFAHTEAEVEIAEDARSARLVKNGKVLLAELEEGEGLTFSVMDPTPLPDTPVIIGQADNAGVRKLTIHAENYPGGRIGVRFTPV